jgi:hypothetical protein
MSKNKLISNKEFWAMLRANGGLYARTARAIKEKFKLNDYARQTVRARALLRPDLLADIEEENIDIAEESLAQIMRSSKQESTRLDATKFYLKTKGKNRGYVERQEHPGEGGKDLPVPLTNILHIHGNLVQNAIPRDDSTSENSTNEQKDSGDMRGDSGEQDNIYLNITHR